MCIAVIKVKRARGLPLANKPTLTFRRLSLPSLRRFTVLTAVYAALCGGIAPVFAAQTDGSNPGDAPAADTAAKAQPAETPDSFWTRSNLLGDIGGLRSTLGDYGISLGLTETSELLGNTSGGVKRGIAYDGLTTLTLGLDTEKAFGWYGGTFNVSGLNIHGQNLSQNNLQDTQTASGIEADTGTRLWEAWYQQKFDRDLMDIKIGQQSIDQEFIVSQYAGTFINTALGWPEVPSLDLPSGGPAYPLSALGVRLRAHLSDTFTLLGGAFDGDPAGDGGDDHGTDLNLHNGTLFIAELQYALNQSNGDTGLPGTYKIGAWYNNEHFDDQHFDTDGLSLANPDSNGNPRRHDGDYSIYAVADQTVWRPGKDSPRSLNAFSRVMGAPGDRNLISYSANAGMTLTAPFTGRDNDTAGLAVGYVKTGSHASDFADDTNAVNNSSQPVRGSETFVEATYQYQLAPWWQLQGDVQYVFNPVDPDDLTQRLGAEAVLGMRTTITF